MSKQHAFSEPRPGITRSRAVEFVGVGLACTRGSVLWACATPVTRQAQESQLDELMARLAEGDRTAFTPVFEQLWGPTFRLCKSMLGDEADAADAAQEALEKVLVRASDYQAGRPALPWALAIASWECRTMLRRRFRRREVSDDSIQWVTAGVAGGPVVGLVGNGVVPDGSAEEEAHGERQLVDLALQALGTLSDSDRETLVATFREEAASVSGATLRKRRERALGRLRHAFRRLYGLD